MFPDSDNFPALFAQGAIYEFITGCIGEKLFSPEGFIPFRVMTVCWAGVPEAAVNENSDACFYKHEVWPNTGPTHLLGPS